MSPRLLNDDRPQNIEIPSPVLSVKIEESPKPEVNSNFPPNYRLRSHLQKSLGGVKGGFLVQKARQDYEVFKLDKFMDYPTFIGKRSKRPIPNNLNTIKIEQNLEEMQSFRPKSDQKYANTRLRNLQSRVNSPDQWT